MSAVPLQVKAWCALTAKPVGDQIAKIADVSVEYLFSEASGCIVKWCKQRQDMVLKQKVAVVGLFAHADIIKAKRCIACDMNKETITECLETTAVADLHTGMRSLRNMENNFDSEIVRAALAQYDDVFQGALHSVLREYQDFFERAFSPDDEQLMRVGSVLADLTATQALVRDLDPGEVRVLG